jgi:hypothetical protein
MKQKYCLAYMVLLQWENEKEKLDVGQSQQKREGDLELERLLHKFKGVFNEPTKLPPWRHQDHKIKLKNLN